MKNLFSKLFNSKEIEISESWWNELSRGWQELIYKNTKYKNVEHFYRDQRYIDEYISYEYINTATIEESFFSENMQVIAQLTEFECYDEIDLSPLQAFKHIKKLEIHLINKMITEFLMDEEKEDMDLSDISYLKGIEEITLSFEFFMRADLKPLAKLKNLTSVSLFLSHASVDLTSLSQLKNLTSLTIVSNSSKLDSLSKLKKLDYLYISDNKSDLSPISQLSYLECLYLTENTVSLEPLSHLTNLKRLHLEGNTANLQPLSKLSNLTYLDLKNNRADLTPINELKNLRHLNLYPRKCKIDTLSREFYSQIKKNGGSIRLYENGEHPF